MGNHRLGPVELRLLAQVDQLSPHSNGNLTGEAERVFEYEHENHLTNMYVSETWRGEYKYK